MNWKRWANILVSAFAKHYPLTGTFFSMVTLRIKCTSHQSTIYRDKQQELPEAIKSVMLESLQNTWHEIEYYLDVLQATKGAYDKTS